MLTDRQLALLHSRFPFFPWWKLSAHTDHQMPPIEVHLITHLQEVLQVLLSQEEVDRDTTAAGGLHEVTQKLHVSEYVHHHSHHLKETGEVQPQSKYGVESQDAKPESNSIFYFWTGSHSVTQ